MRRFRIRPIAALRPYVDSLWGWEAVGDEIIDLPTLLPGTGAEVFFHYRTPFHRDAGGRREAFERAHMICVRRKPIRLCRSRDVGFVAVRFRAGRLHRFTNSPGADLVDGTASVAELWESAGRRLESDVTAASRQADRLRLVQAFLLKELETDRADPLVEHAVAEIYQRCAATSITQLASNLRITRRELERRIKAVTAQTPVEIRRLSRLQKVTRDFLLQQTPRLLSIALKHGFYDQAHFIHNFSSLGLGPPQRHLTSARARPHFYNTPWDVLDHTVVE
jgi:methylphosphotriester-DNA--protein-cysteine methyltransferase